MDVPGGVSSLAAAGVRLALPLAAAGSDDPREPAPGGRRGLTVRHVDVPGGVSSLAAAGVASLRGCAGSDDPLEPAPGGRRGLTVRHVDVPGGVVSLAAP